MLVLEYKVLPIHKFRSNNCSLAISGLSATDHRHASFALAPPTHALKEFTLFNAAQGVL
jgi:hypothetical protein